MVIPYDLLSGGEGSDESPRLSSAVGPHDRWRAEGDRTASAGNTLSIRACLVDGVDESMLERWFSVIQLEFRNAPPGVA